MVEMKEVKPKMSDRIKGFFIMHPLFFAWIIIIAVIMFNSCGKAKADSIDYSSEMWAQVQADMDTYMTNNSSYSAAGAASEYANSQNSLGAGSSISKYVRLVSKDNTQVIYYFSYWESAIFSTPVYSHWDTTEPVTNAYVGFNSYTDTIGLSLTPSDGTRWYFLGIVSNGCRMARCGGNSITNSTSSKLINDNTNMSFYTNNNWLSNGYRYGNNIDISSYFDFTDCVCKGECYIWNPYNLIYHFPSAPEYTDDDRLDIYTLYTNTGKDLVIDLTKFDFSNYDGTEAATQNTLVDEKIYITVSFDGTEQSFTLNSGTSQILRNYIFKTPYSFFRLDSYTDVELINVSFSKLIHYRPNEMKPDENEDYYISCQYWLKHTHEEVEQNDNPYADDVEGSVLTNSEKQALQYLVDFDHGAGLTFSQYHSLDKPDFFEEDATFVYLSDGGTLQDLLEDLSQIPLLGQYADMIASFINNIDDTVELQAAIYDYLYDNAYSQTSSMIVFVYIDSWTDWTAGTFTSDDLTYYYYITTYGRIRQLNQTLADMYVSTKQTENNVAAIFDEVDGFEDSFVDFYNMTIADNATARGWLSTINNSINSLEFPVFDDSDIISKLNEIKTAITGNNSSSEDEDDTIEEAIKYYNNHSIQEAAFEDKFSVWFTGKAHSWLQSKKSNGEPNDPTSNRYYILTGMWGAVCNAYDYLTDESQFWYSFNAYLESLTGTYNTSGTTHTEALDEKHQYMTFFNNGFYDVNEYDGHLTIGE